MKWLGYVVGFYGFSFMFQMIGIPGQENPPYLDAAALGAAVGCLGIWIVRKGLKREQTKADRRALEILQTPEVSHGPFSLYLRPFDIEGKLLSEKQIYSPFTDWWTLVDRPGRDALERLLADAVKRTAPLVGLGSHGTIQFSFGSAGLTPDWKDRIPTIMENALYIFIVPSAHEGTLWELGEIKKNGYLQKSVFIMPRTSSPFKYSGTQDYKLVWDEARGACQRDYGIDLPAYVSEGALFRFDEELRVCRVEGFREKTPRAIAKAINNLREEPPVTVRERQSAEKSAMWMRRRRG